MFASRANQENVVYEQQTAAAAKPLNQGVKGLAPKTPANNNAGNNAAPKTPFTKVALNDENATRGGGKTGGKGKQGGLFGEGGAAKSAKVEGTAFVTPAGPRNRAPLGNKTTNAKATAFLTPAPPTQEKPSAAKHSSPRLRRAKIKIHEGETEIQHDDEEEREIEFMPPREIPLPDYPDDCWPHDRTYPQFEGGNLTRGWCGEFSDHDEDEGFADFEERLKEIEERNRKEKKMQQGKVQSSSSPAAAMKKTALQKTTRDPLTTQQHPPTLKAKNAASALSATSNLHPAGKVPSFAAPTTTSKSRAPANAAVAKKNPLAARTTLPSTAAAGNLRHGAAKVASNSTLGYSKGRAVSSTARKPMGEVDGEQGAVPADTKAEAMKTSLDDLFFRSGGLHLGGGEGEDDDDLGGGVPVFLQGEDEEDDEMKEFLLESVEV